MIFRHDAGVLDQSSDALRSRSRGADRADQDRARSGAAHSGYAPGLACTVRSV